jgi:hypothetical protein
MAEYKPSFRLPFTQFPGLPSEDARRIWRDLDAIAGALIPALSTFDAIIDPTLAASSPGLHQYVNLTELVANETWVASHTLRVGVKNHANVPITEPTTVVISGGSRGDLALFGLGQPLADASHNTWNWKTISCDNTQQVYLYNLSIGGLFSTTIVNNCSLVVAESCYFDSNITSPIASGVSNAFHAKDCYFDGNVVHSSSLGHGQVHYYFDCIMTGSLTIGNNITCTVQGGTIGVAGSKTLTITGSGAAYIESAILANLTIDATSATNIVVVNSALGGNVSVSATVPNVSVSGDWQSVSFTGAPAALRRYSGSADSLDFTGPGQVQHVNHRGGAGTIVKLRGTGVQANVQITLGIAIQCLALVDSLVLADFGVGSTFSLDASSLRNLCVLGGTHQAGWVSTTDSGTGNRIITDSSDSLVSSPPAAAISPNLLPAEIAAVNSGVQTLPAVTSSGATAAQLDALAKDHTLVFMHMGG